MDQAGYIVDGVGIAARIHSEILGHGIFMQTVEKPLSFGREAMYSNI
jgi:hypothetical protein